jgi:ADP-L-glycero-D-manno-heptose 6-epimerase
MASSSPRILVTGALGFIGSRLVHRLNALGYDNIVAADILGRSERWKNSVGMRAGLVDVSTLFNMDDIAPPALATLLMDHAQMLSDGLGSFDVVFHLGACSDTREEDAGYLFRNNFSFSALLYEAVRLANPAVRFVYASSASTYGDGSHGFREGNEEALRPLNGYAWSKQLFDLWLAKRDFKGAAGLKYFNVYGPGEQHKGPMASMVSRGLQQMREDGEIRLFDGTLAMTRDFIHVDDAVAATLHFAFRAPKATGLFNVGTGRATTWQELADAVQEAARTVLHLPAPPLKLIPPPESLMRQYQEHTVADITRLRASGYSDAMRDIRTGALETARELVKNP